MTVGLILALGALALIVALFYSRRVNAISIDSGASSPEEVAKLTEISSAIAEGAMAFLKREYRILSLFMGLFAIIIVFTVNDEHAGIPLGLWSAICFLIGAGTSVVSGYIGMKIATKGNVRTAAAARISLEKSFRIAFESGAVMGFGLTGLAVMGLILVYLGLITLHPSIDQHIIMEILSGFALGGSIQRPRMLEQIWLGKLRQAFRKMILVILP
jgi:K(+)-stimulated pyrophosphate-energized sodium pump